MERIDRHHHIAKSPIPVVSDTPDLCQADAPESHTACNWLGAAMALWIDDDEDDAPRRQTRRGPQTTHPGR